MEQLNFKEEIKKLFEFANSFYKFEQNPEVLLEEIKNLALEDLEVQKDHFSKYIKIKSNKPFPIYFIRFVVLDKILLNETISIELINEIKENISNKEDEYFDDYPRFKDALPNRSDKSISERWGPFAILFQIYFNIYKDEINSSLQYINNTILEFLENEAPEIIGSWAVKKMDFKGSRNYGDSKVWLAFYPEENFKVHKDACQIFFRISHRKVTYGIALGSDIKQPPAGYNKEKYWNKVAPEDFDFNQMKKSILDNFSSYKKFYKEILGNIEPDKPSPAAKTELIRTPKNIILYGPPGTGKTFLSRKLAVDIIETNTYSLNVKSVEIDWDSVKDKYELYKKDNRIKFITFHQAYSYEEFIQGYSYKEDKVILKDGILKKFVDFIHDKGDYENNYIIIIDEINRGNVSKIFGEIITIIEDDKRMNASNATDVILPHTKIDLEKSEFYEQNFILPPNLFMIGTMNTADRSIALLDIALRRRFHFEGIYPDSEIIKNELNKTIEKEEENDYSELFDEGDIEKIQKIFDKLNKRIEVLLDRDHLIGHSYFLDVISNQRLYSVWYGKILPLLSEYFYNDWERLKILLGAYNETQKRGFVKDLRKDYENIFDNIKEIDFPCKIVDYKSHKEQFLEILSRTFEIE